MAQTRAELVDLREKQALEPAAGPHGSDVMHLLHLKPAHHHDHHHSAADLGKDQPQQVCLSLACAGGGGGGGGACDRDATQDCSRASCILAHSNSRVRARLKTRTYARGCRNKPTHQPKPRSVSPVVHWLTDALIYAHWVVGHVGCNHCKWCASAKHCEGGDKHAQAHAIICLTALAHNTSSTSRSCRACRLS